MESWYDGAEKVNRGESILQKLKAYKKRIFDIIQIGNRSDTVSLFFDLLITVVIVFNISVCFLQTFDQAAAYTKLFDEIESVTIFIFVAEYALRLWTAEYLYPRSKKGMAVLKFIGSFYGVIDLLSFLPYFLPFFFPSGAVVFRMLRVVRIFRLFRINASYDAFNVITDVLKDKKDQLFSSIFLVLILMLASSLCMYGLEHDAQPDKFANAFSGIWWSMSTLLTVGYGDIYPVTLGGRLMAIVISFLGVLMVAIPTGIISAGFVEYYTKIKGGMYLTHEADFITLDISPEHPYVGKRIREVELPQGLYPAVLLRGRDVNTTYPELVLQAGDCLVLATTSTRQINAALEEVSLESGHSWVGQQIRELDISRQTFLLSIKRKNRIIKPEGNIQLKEGDMVLLLHRKQLED